MRHLLWFCACLVSLIACTPQSTSRPTSFPNEVKPYRTATAVGPAAQTGQLGVPQQRLTPSPSGPLGGVLVSPAAPLPTPTPFSYTVKSGDTLSQIAEKFRVSLDALLAANPDVNPNAMSVGQTLAIPSSPTNLSGQGTPTPWPVPVDQIACYPLTDGSDWCFVLIHNDGSTAIENVTAQVALIDTHGQAVASRTALLPLDILPPGQSLPLTVFFPPDVPVDATPQVQMLTAIRLLPDDPRYLPARIQNTLVQVAWSGLSAQLSGQVTLPAGGNSAGSVWVAAVAYDGAGNVVGSRRWESSAGLPPGDSLPFSFLVSSVGGRIDHVDFAVEARP